MKEVAFLKRKGNDIDILHNQHGFAIEALANAIEMDKSNLNRILEREKQPDRQELVQNCKRH